MSALSNTSARVAFGLALAWAGASMAQERPTPAAAGQGRPPSVPLVACDPYFSVWSASDRLTDGPTRHWTGRAQPLGSIVRVGGRSFRLMGGEPARLPALPQVGLRVLPTRTIYDFEGEGVHVALTFLTPALPDDLDVLARPVTYLRWDVRSVDGKERPVSLFFSASSELAVDSADQEVTWERSTLDGMDVMRVGTVDQPVLARKGDDLRIDWGHAYLAAPRGKAMAAIGAGPLLADSFVEQGMIRVGDDARKPRAARDSTPTLALSYDLGPVGAATIANHAILAYDDEFSITYFRKNLRPYWRRDGSGMAGLLRKAEAEYEALDSRAKLFDDEVMADLDRAGGPGYARLGALAYRQAIAAHKLAADRDGKPLLFSKENFSNGCIATVDVIYPAAPIFLLFNPTLAKASIAPVLAYSASGRWKFPFAPHDLGTYPIANGQVYGGGERTEDDQMPVEETGNMLLLLAAVARIDGNADFAAPYWPQLQRWAAYLEAKGFDPDNQLCTDDFAGKLAHNVNLSAKAILALGAYGQLAAMKGDPAEADRVRTVARNMAAQWVRGATEGDHTRLAFGANNTWSQKYNLVWDKLLGLDIFGTEVTRKEVASYLARLDTFGLPLDSRKRYAKLDWSVWTATMAESKADFEAIVNPLLAFLDATPDRVPMSDWYWTSDAKQAGFQARSVVGGVFIKLMADPETWKKYAARDKDRISTWGPIPRPPTVRAIVPTARDQAGIRWKITTEQPAGDWSAADYRAEGWKDADGGFGTAETPGTRGALRTEWNTADLWARREFQMPASTAGNLQLHCFHDEGAEIYINGVLAAKLKGYTTDYEPVRVAPEALATLKPGKNTMAIHCHQTSGGQYIDAGLVEIQDAD